MYEGLSLFELAQDDGWMGETKINLVQCSQQSNGFDCGFYFYANILSSIAQIEENTLGSPIEYDDEYAEEMRTELITLIRVECSLQQQQQQQQSSNVAKLAGTPLSPSP